MVMWMVVPAAATSLPARPRGVGPRPLLLRHCHSRMAFVIFTWHGWEPFEIFSLNASVQHSAAHSGTHLFCFVSHNKFNQQGGAAALHMHSGRAHRIRNGSSLRMQGQVQQSGAVHSPVQKADGCRSLRFAHKCGAQVAQLWGSRQLLQAAEQQGAGGHEALQASQPGSCWQSCAVPRSSDPGKAAQLGESSKLLWGGRPGLGRQQPQTRGVKEPGG